MMNHRNARYHVLETLAEVGTGRGRDVEGVLQPGRAFGHVGIESKQREFTLKARYAVQYLATLFHDSTLQEKFWHSEVASWLSGRWRCS